MTKTNGTFKYVVSSRVDLKALGPIVPNCAPRLSYQLSAVQVHTTTYCMYREQHWAPHLLRPVLVSSSIIHIGILTTDYTPMTPPPPQDISYNIASVYLSSTTSKVLEMT